MRNICLTIFLISTLTSCIDLFGDKHLDEKTFQNKDITVTWYQISTIGRVDSYVDIERLGRKENILKGSTIGLHNIILKGDTVIIQATDDLQVWGIKARVLNYYIKLDTSITREEYLQKLKKEDEK